jgi:hypothetical protein
MRKALESDQRFIHITDCKIIALYRKIPKQFGGWKIEISYKEDDEDLFPKYFSILIDQQNFGDELLNADFKKNETRLCYTSGMTDIDIFKRKNDYIIYYSVHDGSYVHFFFSAEEFNQLKSWLELENK